MTKVYTGEVLPPDSSRKDSASPHEKQIPERPSHFLIDKLFEKKDQSEWWINRLKYIVPAGAAVTAWEIYTDSYGWAVPPALSTIFFGAMLVGALVERRNTIRQLKAENYQL